MKGWTTQDFAQSEAAKKPENAKILALSNYIADTTEIDKNGLIIPAVKSPKPKKEKKPKRILVPRTRNANTETESMHMGKIRSALRAMTRFHWKPISAVRKAAQCGYTSVIDKKTKNPKRIPVYKCALCDSITPKIQVDHIHPAGSLRSYSDLPTFCERLFCEDVNSLRAVCLECHKRVTKEGG